MRMQKSGGFMQRNNFCNNSTAEEEQPKREVKPENICSNCGNQLGMYQLVAIISFQYFLHRVMIVLDFFDHSPNSIVFLLEFRIPKNLDFFKLFYYLTFTLNY